MKKIFPAIPAVILILISGCAKDPASAPPDPGAEFKPVEKVGVVPAEFEDITKKAG